MNVYFDLYCVSPKKGDPPFRPEVYITLKKLPQEIGGKRLLSPILMSEREIDETIDQMIKELQILRKKPKNSI